MLLEESQQVAAEALQNLRDTVEGGAGLQNMTDRLQALAATCGSTRPRAGALAWLATSRIG